MNPDNVKTVYPLQTKFAGGIIRKQSVTDGRTDGQTDARTDNVKTVYPLQTKFAGGIINPLQSGNDHLTQFIIFNSKDHNPEII